MGYNPNQPRDPAGEPTGGQWTAEGLDRVEAAAREAAGLPKLSELKKRENYSSYSRIMTYKKLHEIDENPETNKKLSEIITSIEDNGWVGSPLLAVDNQLLNGCHRYTACEILGINPEVYKIESPMDSYDWESEMWFGLATETGTRGILMQLREMKESGIAGLDKAIEIMAEEYNKE